MVPSKFSGLYQTLARLNVACVPSLRHQLLPSSDSSNDFSRICSIHLESSSVTDGDGGVGFVIRSKSSRNSVRNSSLRSLTQRLMRSSQSCGVETSDVSAPGLRRYTAPCRRILSLVSVASRSLRQMFGRRSKPSTRIRGCLAPVSGCASKYTVSRIRCPRATEESTRLLTSVGSYEEQTSSV